MSRLTEREAAAAAVGESAALRRVYEELAPAISGYLRARGSDDPEGLTQDVFVALLPRLGRLQGGVQGLRTLAFSIAHARFVDESRRRGKRPAPVPFDPDDDTRATGSAEQTAMDRAESVEIVELLECLNPDQRSVVALRVVSQLTLEETAQVIGKSVGAVKQLQRRGLLVLREHVQARAEVTP